MTAWDAESRTENIKRYLGSIARNIDLAADTIREAYENKDWQTLGFPTWAAYCEAKFSTDVVRLTAGVRDDLTEQLKDHIGTVDLSRLLGVSRKTTQRDKAKLHGTHVPTRRSTRYRDDEYYSPPEIVKAATVVMGGIDLDPASSPAANEKVNAKRFYTADDDGLAQPWKARKLYLNPPYHTQQVGRFVTRLVREVREGNVKQAVLVVSCTTETAWFQEAALTATAIAFPRNRLPFWRVDGKPDGPGLLGSAILYFGDNATGFRSEFIRFGFVVNTGNHLT